MTSSKILFYLCLLFILGIAAESIFNIPQFILWIFLFAAILIIVISAVCLFLSSQELWNKLLIVSFCVLFLIFGVLRVQITEFDIANDKLSKLNDSEEKITLTGTIAGEPDIRESSQKLKIKIDNFGSIVLVTAGRYPEYKYLGKVKITGKLETPIETEEFSYKNYLLKDHIYSVMYFPEMEETREIDGSPISAVYAGILWVKQKMRQSIRDNFSMPHSSVLEAMVLGSKSAISQDIKGKFQIAGLSHIIAVSGMHIMILSAIMMFFLLYLGVARNRAFYAVVFFIILYVILVGMPASAIRAGIMGAIYLLGEKLGRQTMSLRIIVLAAAFMLLFNPLILFYDVGFQLSFLAVSGIILLEPVLRKLLKLLIFIFFRARISSKHENILLLFTVTISAQIFTLPIIIYNFGNISLVSPLTNLLILPIMPIIMLFGFLSALAGTIFSSLGWLLSVPCYVLLDYAFFIINVFSKPWAYRVVSNASWGWIAASYVFLGAVTRYFRRKVKAEFLDYN